MPISLIVSTTAIATGVLKPSPKATVRRAGGNSRSPTSCRSSGAPASPTRCGLPPTCTTPPPITTIPTRRYFQDFEPFWEFVSGPIHAGSFGPNQLDNTFGPQLVYIKAPTKEQGQNAAPTYGLQFFGHVAIDGATGVMTVTLKDWDDNALWSTKLEPKHT